MKKKSKERLDIDPFLYIGRRLCHENIKTSISTYIDVIDSLPEPQALAELTFPVKRLNEEE